MKNWLLIFGLFICVGFTSCCKCMNCPGFGLSSGTGSDEICKEDYEASNPSMSWEMYTDYNLQTGCTCVK